MRAIWARWKVLGEAERRLLVEATLMVGMCSGALRVLPDRLTGALLNRACRSPQDLHDGAADVEAIARSIERVAGRLPGASCLSQGLAGWLMLRRRRTPAVLRVGVNRRAPDALSAHAWLEVAGQVVVGADEAALHVAFPEPR